MIGSRRFGTARIRAAGAFAALLFSLLEGGALGESSGDREEFRRSFNKTLPLAAGQKLQVEHSNGDVRIRTHGQPEVRVDAVIRVSSSDEEAAQKFSNEIQVTAEPGPGGVVVRTRFPEKKWVFSGSGHVSYSVDFDILMPETAGLSIKNRFGSVSVTGLKASADIRNSNGAIAFRDGRGTQRLENSFGSIDLVGNVGDAVIGNSNGSVQVIQLQGKLEARNRFGRVTASRVTGSSDITNSNGSVTLEGASGPAVITNSFGAVILRNIGGGVTVRNSNGSIEAANITGEAELNSTFGGIQFSDMRKTVSCTGSNARISGARVADAVTIRTTFGTVEVRETGALDIENSNGKVIVREVRGPAKLTTSFGAIDAMGIGGDATLVNSNAAITVQKVAGSVDARSRFGKISVSHVKGGVTVNTDNSTVTVADVQGPAFVKTSFGLLEAARVNGNLTAENNNGGVKAVTVGGAATVRASFGAVVIQGAGAGVEVTNQNGSVDVSGLSSARCQRIVVKTSFAPIRVALPEDASYDLNARTSFGKVNTQVPLDVSGAISSENLNARIGKGKCELSLTNSNGNIDLLKEGVAAAR